MLNITTLDLESSDYVAIDTAELKLILQLCREIVAMPEEEAVRHMAALCYSITEKEEDICEFAGQCTEDYEGNNYNFRDPRDWSSPVGLFVRLKNAVHEAKDGMRGRYYDPKHTREIKRLLEEIHETPDMEIIGNYQEEYDKVYEQAVSLMDEVETF